MDGKTMGIGGIIMLAMALIVGVTLLQSSAQNVGSVVNSATLTNYSLGTQTNGTAYYLAGYKSLTVTTMWGNATNVDGNVTSLNTANYTLTNGVVNPTTGVVSVKIVPNSSQTGTVWRVIGTAEPDTYGDSGSRAMSNLIIILMALALAVAGVGFAVKGFSE